ncbi:hypothetical protein ASF72_07125 [Arthrobacter sp. Leaf141]|uniref:serine hydrolase domain-containing protein n=1 Tax=Arthrobacter sp. Leaf141 TaxID=1736273 RepID=UPI0006F81D8B|nr:serine hydrolase domain-containing protein [Arthrobacter sp. Leaf141]KQR02953.1 hypothetical protein ASF72_07125 [Arthrobacter sp. Leaf141]
MRPEPRQSKYLRIVAAAVLLVGSAGCTGAPDPPDQQTRTAPAFVGILQRYSADLLTAGATAVIIDMKSRVGDWSSAAGVRDLDTMDPAQLSDQSQVGDITTAMVAVSVLKLVEEGKIQLDDPVQQYLPGLEGIVKPPGPITIRSLLSHRSGMPDYWVSPVHIGTGPFTHEERVGFVAGMPWTGGSGSLYSYSATNYSVLALLVEKLRGRSIGVVIREDSVAPLNLQHTLMTGDAPGPQRMLHGYTRTAAGDLEDNALAPFHLGSPDTGMISTVGDLNTYFAALQDGSLLAPGSVAEMHHPKYQEFGLGLVRKYDACSNNDYFGHVGVVRGYAALALISADGSRQLAMIVARAPRQDPVGFDDPESLEMAEAALAALNSAC